MAKIFNNINDAGPFNANVWQRLFPPWRPSEKDMEIFSKIVNGFDKNNSFLVLGATPEIRDLLFESGIRKRTIVDISKKSIEEMTKARKWPNESGENQIVADWLSMPFGKEKFDVIIADLPFWVLPNLESHKGLINSCRNVLKEDGSIVVRVHFRDKTFDYIDFGTLIQWIRKQCIRNTYNFHEFKSLFNAVLVDYFSSSHTNIFDHNRCLCFLESLNYNNKFIRWLWQNLPIQIRNFGQQIIISSELACNRIPVAYVDFIMKNSIKPIAVKYIMDEEIFISIISPNFYVKKINFHYNLPVSPHYPILWLQKK